MSAKRSFILILQILFVLFSLQFLRDAFYKWDGYSYYMTLVDFLSEASLVYIFIVVFVLIFACLIWLGLYILNRVTTKFVHLHFEHLLMWFILCIFVFVLKRIFSRSFPLTGIFGMNYFMILMVGSIITAIIVWLLRKYNETLLNVLNNRITPLVWLFLFILILAVPFSFLKIKKNYLSNNSYISNAKEQSKDISSNSNRPNIILVIMDALTARNMHLYGYERLTTPFISEWAKNAIVFNRAYSSSNWTSTSMMSMMTGQRPWTHKIWHYVYYNHVGNYENNFPAILKYYGYDLYSFVQNPYAHPEVLGIQDSFLTRDKSRTFSRSAGWGYRIRNFLINNNLEVFDEWIFQVEPFSKLITFLQPSVTITPYPSEIVYNRFLEYISKSQKQAEQRPFFAWLHLWPPHESYLPPEPFIGIYGDAERYNTSSKQEKRDIKREYKPERQKDVDILRKRYDEFILYSDKQFEIFWLNLTKTLDMSNTIVILTSDHGESFSHGYQEHGGSHLYEPLVHVPLLIKLPNKMKGEIIDMPVEQIDIAPTILELVGIPVPEWMEGRSLIPLFNGEYIDEKPVFSFSMDIMKNRFGLPITKGTIAIWDRDYKLIYYLENKKTLLFNLRSDPGETMNIYKEKPEISQNLMKLIDDNLSRANTKIIQPTER